MVLEKKSLGKSWTVSKEGYRALFGKDPADDGVNGEQVEGLNGQSFFGYKAIGFGGGWDLAHIVRVIDHWSICTFLIRMCSHPYFQNRRKEGKNRQHREAFLNFSRFSMCPGVQMFPKPSGVCIHTDCICLFACKWKKNQTLDNKV